MKKEILMEENKRRNKEHYDGKEKEGRNDDEMIRKGWE